MSLFADSFTGFFAPALMWWHGDPIGYLPVDAPEGTKPIEIKKALVSDETVQRRRKNDFEYDLVTLRAVQIVTDKDSVVFSGVSDPQQNATVRINVNCECIEYVVERLSEGDDGMAKLDLIRVGAVAVAQDGVIGE